MTDTAELAELIARLELAKRSLPNVAGGIADVEACADLIGEAQAALAAQAQEIEQQNIKIQGYHLANFEQRFIEQRQRAEAAEARARVLENMIATTEFATKEKTIRDLQQHYEDSLQANLEAIEAKTIERCAEAVANNRSGIDLGIRLHIAAAIRALRHIGRT